MAAVPGKGMVGGTSPAAASKELWSVSFLQKCLVIVAAAWHLAACSNILGIEDLPVAPDATPPVYTVRGTAVGLLEPVSLRLEHPGGFELLSVEADGTFAFEAQLGDDAIYSVTLLGDPPCVIGDAFGTVSGNIPLIQLACESVLLSALAIDGATAPELAFAPAERNYEAEVSILQQSVRITATTAKPGSTINVAGVPMASGVPSEPIELTLGQNDIDIAVANANGVQRIYRVSVMRAVEIAQYAYGKASNTAPHRHFGYSVALWNDTLAVGTSYNDFGTTLFPKDSVYVFRRSGDSWVQEAHWENGDGFGHSVAVWEDTLAIGNPYAGDIVSGVTNRGYVYIYRRTNNSWVEEAYLTAPAGDSNDQFGTSVSLWGDTLAVGAVGESSAATGVNGDQTDNNAAGSGAAYVFRRAESSWQLEAYIKASNTEAQDAFGSHLALWGDTLVVGAPGEDSAARSAHGDQVDNAASGSGAGYVFRRFGASWVQEAYLKASNTDPNDAFGDRLALWNDTLAVSALGEDGGFAGIDGDQMDNSLDRSGAVYMFQRSGLDWTQDAYIKASNPDAVDLFGISLALWGDTLAVGATGEDSGATGIGGNQHDASALSSGAVYLYHHTSDSWVQSTYVKASNAEGKQDVVISGCQGDLFGRSVAVWEQRLVAGASCESSAATGLDGDQHDDSAAESGAVYFFQ
jgi:hypothetical protein